MQEFMLAIITGVEKHTLMRYRTWNFDKKPKEVRNIGQGHRFLICA